VALALASSWRRAALAGVSLFALGACGTEIMSDAAPVEAPVVDRPERVASEMARGQQALSAGDLSTAQAAFTAALRGSPNDPEPALGLAETYLAMGDLKTAGKLFDLVEKSSSGPDEGRLLQGRGLVALGQGETDEAVRLLERSVDRSPGLWRAWAGLGRAYGRQGKSRQARDAFARAEDAAPARALVINDIGMLHLEENDPAAALEAFQRALAIDPANLTASANARIARAMLGDYDAAASGARPEELPDVLNNVGYIAIVNGDFEVADRFLRRAVEISPVYHEAASANLDLLAQAMKGVPVLATAGRGVSSPQAATGTELSSVSGDLPEGQGETAPDPAAAVAALAPGGAAPPPGPAAVGAALGASGPAPAASANAPQDSTVMAHGFRWESPPVSAKKKKRKRRSTPPAAGAADGDPRTAEWPAVAPWSGPAPDSPAASAPVVAEPAAESQAPAETTDAPDAGPEHPDAWRAEAPAEVPGLQAAQASSAPTEAAPRSGTAPGGASRPE
jgi:Flp pilus assembly protein TadD